MNTESVNVDLSKQRPIVAQNQGFVTNFPVSQLPDYTLAIATFPELNLEIKTEAYSLYGVLIPNYRELVCKLGDNSWRKHPSMTKFWDMILKFPRGISTT